jgi:hypothetical protein
MAGRALIGTVAVALVAGCAPTPTPVSAGAEPTPSSVAPSSAPSPSQPPLAPAPADPARQALEAEIAALEACGPEATFGSCAAFDEFAKPHRTPATRQEEELLFARLEHPGSIRRLAILIRLAHQPGPRTRDFARTRTFFALAQKLTDSSPAESKWLGRALGAVSLDTRAARDAIRAFVASAKEPLAAATLVGIGVAHPGEPSALDVVDSFRKDSRPGVRLATLDAYADAHQPDPARSCASWAAALGDAPNRLRGAALLSVSPECSAHHLEVLALAEKRLKADPNDAMVIVLPGLCQTKATASRAEAIAKRIVTRVARGSFGDPLRTIGKCDPRGPKAALAPYAARKGDLGRAAERALGEISAEEEAR